MTGEIPWAVTADCPTADCPQRLQVRWPSDDPDTVVCQCHRCDEKCEVSRDGSVAAVATD